MWTMECEERAFIGKLLLAQARAPICTCAEYGIGPDEYCDCWQTLCISEVSMDIDKTVIVTGTHVVTITGQQQFALDQASFSVELNRGGEVFELPGLLRGVLAEVVRSHGDKTLMGDHPVRGDIVLVNAAGWVVNYSTGQVHSPNSLNVPLFQKILVRRLGAGESLTITVSPRV